MSEDKKRTLGQQVKEDIFVPTAHSLGTFPTALLQDYAAGGYWGNPEKAQDIYQRVNQIHKNTLGDNIDDESWKHDMPKILVDAAVTSPLGTLATGAIGYAGLRNPLARNLLTFGANEAIGVGAGYTKAKTAGREYDLLGKDGIMDAALSFPSSVMAITKPSAIGYAAANAGMRTAFKNAKGKAEEVIKESLRDEGLSEEEIERLLAYGILEDNNT